MKDPKNQGLTLTPSPQSDRDGWAAALAAEVLLCLGLESLVLGLTGLPAGVMAVTGLVLCLCHRFLAENHRDGWFLPGVLALALLTTLVLRTYAAEGFRICWNRMGQTLTARRGWALPQWKLLLAENRQGFAQGVFLALLGAGAALIAGLTAQRAPGAFALLLLPGLAVAAVLNARSLWLIPALGAGMCLLAYGGRQANRGSFLGWALCLVLLAGLGTVLSGEKAQTAWDRLQQETRQRYHRAAYETQYTVLPEGDLSKALPKSENAVPGLTVELSAPETLYLRGFTGAILEDDRWRATDSGTLAENETLLRWLNESAFFPQSQYAAAAAGMDLEESRITVHNVGACSAYTYVPFSLSGGDFLKTWNLNTDAAPGNGNRQATYSLLSGSPESIRSVTQALQAQTDTDYRRAESAYRDYVRQNYLQIPRSVSDLLERAWSQVEEENKAVPADQQAQRCVVSFLSRCFPETGEPELKNLPLPQMSGTSYQYATVAVMTLRRFGIPARYAEGYVLPEEQAKAGTVTLDSTCARAWPEIYQDGIGWIPMELTPGLGEQIQEEQQLLDSETTGDQEKDTREDTPKPEENPQPDMGTVAGKLRRNARWLLPVLLVLLLVLLLWLRKNWLARRRMARFRNEDLGMAATALFADSLMLLETLGLRRGNESPLSLREPMARQLGEEFAGRFLLAQQINAQALFSSHPVGQDQYDSLLAFYQETVGCLKKKLSLPKRLWLQWGRCVY